MTNDFAAENTQAQWAPSNDFTWNQDRNIMEYTANSREDGNEDEDE